MHSFFYMDPFWQFVLTLILEGTVVDIPLGIVGAVLGGWLFNLFGGTGVTGFNIDSIYNAGIAAIGAIILLALYHAFFPPPHVMNFGRRVRPRSL